MRIPTAVYAEITPNPAVMKFVADRLLIPDGLQAEFRSKRSAVTTARLDPVRTADVSV